MSKLIAAIALMAASAANAAAPNSKSLTCDAIQAAVERGGRVSIVAYPDGPYNSRSFVKNDHYCVNSSKSAYGVSIETADGRCYLRACFSNYQKARAWDRNH